MTATLTFRGRLPGVAVDSVTPPTGQPIRLDVPGFVGFAERGPLDLAVAVDSDLEYTTVFGGDLALAQEAGQPVYAQLPAAVQAFFDNGGRRCYVVRVAGPSACPGRWAVPGLQVWQPDGHVDAAVVGSAWPGGWSAGTTVLTNLLAQQLRVTGPYTRVDDNTVGELKRRALPLAPEAVISVRPGDLLRLDLQGFGGLGLFTRVQSLDPASSTVVTDVDLWVTVDDTPVHEPHPALPPQLTVTGAELLRFDLIVYQQKPDGSRQLDRLTNLAFGAPATTPDPRQWWAGALQPADDPTPDPTLSMTLRQDPKTMQRLNTGLAVPIGMSGDGSGVQSPALQDGEDGLSTFDPRWLIDPELASDTVLSLATHADQLTALSRTPQALRGVHALLSVDEVAMLAVPDATQRGWSPAPPPVYEPPPQPPPPSPPDWSHFRCCTDTVPAPTTQQSTPQKPTAPPLPQLQPVGEYDEDPLIDVHSALITMCAARADAVALLSVPQHYDVAATLAWAARITSIGTIDDGAGGGVPPLSYAAMWHPWISNCTGLDGGSPVLRDLPPDGAVAGMIAARENARGVWVAPAGIALRGPVRLAAPTALTIGDRVQLFDAHANLVQQRPGVFTTLSAHTLSGNPQLLQVSVRRLLILLRKICLQLGERYTFEVNNDRFRQLVRMRFDRILSNLTDRGALQAFRVDIAGGLNTAEDQDAGRFIVALQVAPTSPVEFITVTLVRSGEGLLDVVEG